MMRVFQLTAAPLALLVVLGTIAGCQSETEAPAPEEGTAAAATDSAYLLTSEPSGALGVKAAREGSEESEEVTLVGRIGGSAEPFVDGIAAFTIVDPQVPHCSADEGCPTPWDYCCETDQLKDNSAMVQIVDAEGNAVGQDARDLLGVNELAMVVVQGKARRDEAGNLTVAADKVFVKDTP